MTQLNKEVISKGSKIRLRSWLKILKTSNYIEKQIREKLRKDHNTTLPRFDVMSALQSVIRASMSSPATIKRRRIALSVTTSFVKAIGLRWRRTSFWTNFILASIGSLSRLKISGVIRAPLSSWP